MKLSQLAAKPQLIKLTIDDKELIDKYSNGEALEFYTWDRQPLNVFMKLSAAQGSTNNSDMIEIVRTLILDEKGKEIITEESALPAVLLIKAISVIVERLGK
jgi:hypothetical protein